MAPNGTQLAADALRYQGSAYVWGGRADTPDDADCSSGMSLVLGRDFGLELPGGGHYGSPGYPPNDHGPVVYDYLISPLFTTVDFPQAGDLVIYGPDAHIGMHIGRGQFFSWLNPSLGARVEAVTGAPVYRRVNGVEAGARAPGAPLTGFDVTAAWQNALKSPVWLEYVVPGLVVVGVVAGAVLLSGLLFAGGGALVAGAGAGMTTLAAAAAKRAQQARR